MNQRIAAQRIARLTGVTVHDCEQVISEFLNQARQTLAMEESMRFEKLGLFRVRRIADGQPRIDFFPATTLLEAIASPVPEDDEPPENEQSFDSFM